MISSWYPITSQQATPMSPPKTMPTCTSVYRCHACLDFRRVLPICRKSRHVSATLTNELQHMLLWMVGRRIGSAIIRSRKTKIVYVCVYFWKRFSVITLNRFLNRRMIVCARVSQKQLLESRKKNENSCSCKSATPLVHFTTVLQTKRSRVHFRKFRFQLLNPLFHTQIIIKASKNSFE